MSGACGPATPARRFTPIPGRGTRSASPARPTRVATSTPESTPARGGRSPTTHDVDPVPFAQRVERPAKADDDAAGQWAAVSDYRTIRARNESAWLIPNDGSRVNHQLTCRHAPLRRDDEVDVVIVGAGAGGGTLAQRLARAGWRTVVLDAGPFWNPDTDWVSDERGSHGLYWTDPGQIGGADPVPLGSNNSGRGVGGSMVHYAGYVPRFHPSDFHTHSADGVGADWPISYDDPPALLRDDRSRAARRRTGLAMGRSTSLPAQPASRRRQRADLRCAAPGSSGSRCG